MEFLLEEGPRGEARRVPGGRLGGSLGGGQEGPWGRGQEGPREEVGRVLGRPEGSWGGSQKGPWGEAGRVPGWRPGGFLGGGQEVLGRRPGGSLGGGQEAWGIPGGSGSSILPVAQMRDMGPDRKSDPFKATPGVGASLSQLRAATFLLLFLGRLPGVQDQLPRCPPHEVLARLWAAPVGWPGHAVLGPVSSS